MSKDKSKGEGEKLAPLRWPVLITFLVAWSLLLIVLDRVVGKPGPDDLDPVMIVAGAGGVVWYLLGRLEAKIRPQLSYYKNEKWKLPKWQSFVIGSGILAAIYFVLGLVPYLTEGIGVDVRFFLAITLGGDLMVRLNLYIHHGGRRSMELPSGWDSIVVKNEQDHDYAYIENEIRDDQHALEMPER